MSKKVKIQNKFIEVYRSLLGGDSNSVLLEAVMEKYQSETDVSGSTAYRHWNSTKHLFESKRDWNEYSGKKKKYISLIEDKPTLEIESFNRKVIAMHGDDRLKAFVLETVRLFPEHFKEIGDAAKLRVKKISIEKKIHKHEGMLKALKVKLNEIHNQQ